jgi:membrane-associated phospholipid phosphatase
MGNSQVQSTIELPPRRIDLLKVDGRNGVNSVLHAYFGPARWKKKDWLLAGGIAVGTYGLFLLDEQVNPVFTNQHDDIPKIVRDLAFYFGKPQYNYGLTAAVYGLGILTKNEKIRKTGILLIASATTAGFIQSVSKTVIGRARPSTGVGNSDFDFFNGTPDYHSFPSGHAILAFTTAHALARSVHNPWLKVGIYSLGAVTPVSRLWTNAHWLSDIGLSLAISIISVDSVFNYLERSGDYEQKGLTPGISWRLNGGPSSVGLVGTF